MSTITMAQWGQRVEAFLQHGTPSQKMLVCEGTTGCGKSEMTVQTCERLGLTPVICPGLGSQMMEDFLASTMMVAGTDGTGRLQQDVLRNIIPTQELVGKPGYTLNGRDCIVWIIDEVFTGTIGQMNQLRSILTYRKVGSVEIPRCTYLIGSTNPMGDEYISRRAIDRSILDRTEIMCVELPYEDHLKYLRKLTADQVFPKKLLKLLGEDHALWSSLSPRAWANIGATGVELELSDMPLVDKSEIMAQAVYRLADESVRDYAARVVSATLFPTPRTRRHKFGTTYISMDVLLDRRTTAATAAMVSAAMSDPKLAKQVAKDLLVVLRGMPSVIHSAVLERVLCIAEAMDPAIGGPVIKALNQK